MRSGAGSVPSASHVRASLIVDHGVCDHRSQHRHDRRPSSPDGARVMPNDLPGSPRPAGWRRRHGEPPGGLALEAGHLLTLGLGELRQHGLPQHLVPATVQQVHDRWEQPPPRRRPGLRCLGSYCLALDSRAVDIQFVELDRALVERPGYQQPRPGERRPCDYLVHRAWLPGVCMITEVGVREAVGCRGHQAGTSRPGSDTSLQLDRALTRARTRRSKLRSTSLGKAKP